MLRLTFARPVAAAALLLATAASTASASDPRLKFIQPRGVQRGAERELTFHGDRLKDAQEVFFYTPGFEVTKIEPAENGKSAKVTVKVAADAALGEHVAQVRCASGVSDFKTFYVGALPETAEVEPNNDFETPQPIPLNTTVVGVVQSEDVDLYVVEARKGQRLTAEIEGLRLGTDVNTLFDPFVAILDANRFELAVADDTPLLYQDGLAAIVAPEDGKYVVLVRDSSYRGNGNSHYRLHVGEFPQPLAVLPAGGPAGKPTEVTFIGDVAGDFTQAVTPPSDPAVLFALHAEREGRLAPTANVFRVSPFDNVMEQEPNDEAKLVTVAAVAAPIALNGVLSQEKDVDFLKFSAKKGESLRIECYARRLRTPVDPVLSVHKADGGQLAANDDDGRSPDSGLDFNVPADGDYFVAVRDHLGRSGPHYVYRVEIAAKTPALSLSVPRVTRYDQDRQRIAVPQGGKFATLVNASRKDFGGELVLEADALPPGVTMAFEPMAANLNSMPVVFEAAADAPLGGRLVDLKGYKKDGPKEQSGRFENTADLVRVQNAEMLWQRDVDRLAVVVVEKLPFSIEIVEPKAPLVRNGSMGLKVVAKREEGFTKAINVEFPFRPPGVGTTPNVSIPEGQTECVYPLNADGNGAIGTWKVYCVATADVDGTAFVGTALTNLTIADNQFQLALERAAVKQGETVEVFAKVEQKGPFEGPATLTLLGLPNKAVAEPVQITKDSTEVRFKVTTEADTPVGRHQNVFCDVKLTVNGEEVAFRGGQVELRVDPPPPAPKTPAPEKPKEEPKPEAAKPPEKPPEKPLSRLEQLRLEAKQKLEAGQ